MLSQRQVKDEEEVYFNFINSIKFEVTKKDYEDGVKLYLKYCNHSKLSELLTIADPQKQIIEYIMSLRKKGLSSNTISTWLLGIYHLYELNDFTLFQGLPFLSRDHKSQPRLSPLGIIYLWLLAFQRMCL